MPTFTAAQVAADLRGEPGIAVLSPTVAYRGDMRAPDVTNPDCRQYEEHSCQACRGQFADLDDAQVFRVIPGRGRLTANGWLASGPAGQLFMGQRTSKRVASMHCREKRSTGAPAARRMMADRLFAWEVGPARS